MPTCECEWGAGYELQEWKITLRANSSCVVHCQCDGELIRNELVDDRENKDTTNDKHINNESDELIKYFIPNVIMPILTIAMFTLLIIYLCRVVKHHATIKYSNAKYKQTEDTNIDSA
jgi:hypothetical protein